MIRDHNKGIKITYNFLNLPANIVKIDSEPTPLFCYNYDAMGRKLRQKTYLYISGRQDNTRDYAGAFVYSNKELSYVNHPYGRFTVNNENELISEFHVRDHLGNTRIVFVAGNTGDKLVTQEPNYYPFGKTIHNLNYNHSSNRYLYNSKEFETANSLNWYDYGFRFYDPQIARWHVQDPLAEKYYSISPYAYVANNPIIYIDPDGREIWLYQYDEDGNGVAELQYTPGMEYDGDNTFFANAITTLNQMNSVEIGSMVLSDLHVSDNVFGVTNLSAVIGDAHQFIENAEGGSILRMGENFALEGLAHEMFHGYQHEMGQGGASIFNEVEANLFGYSVTSQYAYDNTLPFGSATPMGNANAAGRAFENSFYNLLQSNTFPREQFDTAVQNFQRGSIKNATGAIIIILCKEAIKQFL